MKKFMYLILMSVLISCTNEPGTDGGNGTDPVVRVPITHTGTLMGKQFTLHGQVESIKLFSKYSRLSKDMIDNTLTADDDDDTPGKPVDFNNGIKKLKGAGNHIDNAGFYIAFDTDATKIDIEATLRKTHGTKYPSANQFQLLQFDGTEYKSVVDGSDFNETTLLSSLTYTPTATGEKKYILLFPAYNGIAEDKDLQITVNKEAKVYNSFPFNEDKQLPILVYGTSVTQGAWGTTLKDNYTSILSLESKREVLNLGFSGSAYIDAQMVDYLKKIPSHIFFLDPALNLYSGEIVSKARARYMIEEYRKYNKTTPIVVVATFHYQSGDTPEEGEGQEGKTGQWLKDVVEEYPKDKNLHFLSRAELGNFEYADTVDGTHPNSQGMRKWADAYLKMMTTLKK